MSTSRLLEMICLKCRKTVGYLHTNVDVDISSSGNCITSIMQKRCRSHILCADCAEKLKTQESDKEEDLWP